MLSVFTLSLEEIFLILINRMKISVTMITISVQINSSTIFTTTNVFTVLLQSKRIKHEVGGETTVHCVTFPCTKSLVKPGFYPGPSLVKKPGYPGS